jgi:hypothetical protein
VKLATLGEVNKAPAELGMPDMPEHVGGQHVAWHGRVALEPDQ